MKYMGNKRRIAKHILPIILENRQKDQWYVEPFVGAFGTMDKVTGNRLAADVNPYLIKLYQAVQLGWIPPDNITEEEYKAIKEDKGRYCSRLVGFVGFGCSFGGKFFGGYARGKNSKGEPRNYCNESKKSILKQAKNLKGIVIVESSYQDLYPPENSIIYCDPPYAGTTKYKGIEFDTDDFWDWCSDKAILDHRVFVSEYKAPAGWKSIWSKEINVPLNDKSTRSNKGIEHLFIYEL